MKERPILFSAPMVRAILAGKKTQTRRVVRDQGSISDVAGGGIEPVVWWPREGDRLLASPYGQPGDRLWVREAWKPVYHPACEAWEDVQINYKAGGWAVRESSRPQWPLSKQWKPSIHMPRWASRITLDVTGIRVERLQDISEADAQAEGAELDRAGAFDKPSYRAGFEEIWRGINGSKSWDANPWVWVVEFRRPAVSGNGEG